MHKNTTTKHTNPGTHKNIGDKCIQSRMFFMNKSFHIKTKINTPKADTNRHTFSHLFTHSRTHTNTQTHTQVPK